MLSVTGMTIEETLSRKMSEIERRKDGHARIRLQARATKKRYLRYVFLTKEVVGWIDDFHSGIRNTVTVEGGVKRSTDTSWVFPGERENCVEAPFTFTHLHLLNRLGTLQVTQFGWTKGKGR